MDNYTGILYKSGGTQNGVFFKNGFGSVYAVSGAGLMESGLTANQPIISSITSYTGTVFNRIVISGATGTSFSSYNNLSSFTMFFSNPRLTGNITYADVSGYTPSSRTSYINYTSFTYSGNQILDNAIIYTRGINEVISETQGFIFWTKFRITSRLLSAIQYFNSNSEYFGTRASGFTFQIGTLGLSFGLGYQAGFGINIASSSMEDPSRIPITGSTETPYECNILIYKDPNKNFTTASAFTTYQDNYIKTHSLGAYPSPTFLINDIRCFFKGSFPTDASFDCVAADFYVYNIGFSRTNMTPAEFDLFAQKMLKYDNYWHLFEGETDTPNINKSDVILYMPMYQKFGGNNIRTSRINVYYPKTGVSAFTTSNTAGLAGVRSKFNMSLGNKNRWRKPYPPFDPYV
jgi:hypothetical protein